MTDGLSFLIWATQKGLLASVIWLQLPNPNDFSSMPLEPRQKAANKRVVDGHNAEGSCVVPAEAHGDEHDVRVVLLVPGGRSRGWEQHKPNLPEPGALKNNETGPEKFQHNIVPKDHL